MSSWTEFLVARGAKTEADTVLSFGDLTAELEAARDSAVVCDLGPLSTLSVNGPDAAQFLQGQLTNDVLALAPGAWQFGAWCSPKGRMLVNFVLRRTGPEHFELLLPATMLETIRKRLGLFMLRSRVVIEDTSARTVRLGIGGPASSSAVRDAFGDIPTTHQVAETKGAATVALSGARFVAWVDPQRAAKMWERFSVAARPAGFPVWEWLTIRAGVPRITPPTADQYVPQTANWDALEGLSFNKGCYSGQEIVARMQYLGRLKERLVLAHVEASPPQAGARLFSAAFGDQPCGSVVNAATSPAGGADLLAVLQIAARESADVRVGSPDGPVLALLPLPYPVPEAAPPRGRIA